MEVSRRKLYEAEAAEQSSEVLNEGPYPTSDDCVALASPELAEELNPRKSSTQAQLHHANQRRQVYDHAHQRFGRQ
jgi:hypothetical protein